MAKICVKYIVELTLVFSKCYSGNIENCRKCVKLNYEAAIPLFTTNTSPYYKLSDENLLKQTYHNVDHWVQIKK